MVASSWVIIAGGADVVAGAEPGAVVDRRLDPALGARYRLVTDNRGAGIAAGRQLRQLRRRKDACGIDPDSDELDRRILLGEGVEPLVPPVKCGDCRRQPRVSTGPAGHGTVNSRPWWR